MQLLFLYSFNSLCTFTKRQGSIAMGWFDDSESDEDVSTKRKPLEVFADDLENDRSGSSTVSGVFVHTESNIKNSLQDNGEDLPKINKSDAGDDPLDSYMNSLSSNDDKDNITKQRSQNGRLDMDNEDEATSHWKCGSVENASSKSPSLKDIGDNESGSISYNYESIKAKAAIASTFHKSGEGVKKVKDSKQRLCDDPSIDRKQKTIEPLEKVDHMNVNYQTFRKKFHQPTSTEFGNFWRKSNQVTCSIAIDPIESFTRYGPSDSDNGGVFAEEVLDYLTKNNFNQATLVQAQCIPVALAGHDLLVTSRTGSGKTLGFVLPLVTHVIDQPHILPNVDGPIAIILTPTRELAKQVNLIVKKLLHVVGGKSVAVTGGTGTYEMVKELKKGCEVIVSTPGRFIDMVKRKATNCRRITLVILDEADKMLEMGFESQCSSILTNVRPDRQTFMFSATLGRKIERVAKGWLRNPIRIAVGQIGSSSEHVDQQVLILPNHDAKVIWLLEMVPTLYAVGKMIIFVQSRVEVDTLTEKLKNTSAISGSGILVDSIHGERHQTDRNAALSAFRKGKIRVLIATDVAARGLDVCDVMTVINFDPAKNLDSHVHRIGRAGRLDKNSPEHKKGVAYTLLTSKNADFAHALSEAFGREGREVNEDLLKLAMNSKYSGVKGGHTRHNKYGLGFVEDADAQKKRKRSFFS